MLVLTCTAARGCTRTLEAGFHQAFAAQLSMPASAVSTTCVERGAGTRRLASQTITIYAVIRFSSQQRVEDAQQAVLRSIAQKRFIPALLRRLPPAAKKEALQATISAQDVQQCTACAGESL